MKVQMPNNKLNQTNSFNIHEIPTPIVDKINMLKIAKLRLCPSDFGALPTTYSKQE
jgi:hypothetical protein